MSYVKKPLKISRYEKNMKDPDNESEKSFNAQTVGLSGSEADLRKLKLEKVNNYLREFGENPKKYKKRWDKI